VLKFANSLWTTDGQLQSCTRRLVNTCDSLGLELENPGLRYKSRESAIGFAFRAENEIRDERRDFDLETYVIVDHELK